MNEIAPPYYAGGTSPREYNLVGSGFNGIPQDAIGLFSTDNDDPTMFLNDIRENRSYLIEVVDNEHAVLTHKVEQSPQSDNYLGCICSPDGSKVYWINDTRPLP